MTLATKESYESFLYRKSQIGGMAGFDSIWMPDFLKPFQRHLVERAVRKGRSAIFADCFVPGTLVMTDGVYRPIESCDEGMLIETLSGPALIEKFMSREYDGPTVKVKTASRERCTVPSRANSICSPHCSKSCATKPHTRYKISIISASELTLDDCLLYRQPVEKRGAREESDAYLGLAGLWLAEGWLSRVNGKLYGIHLAFALDEEYTLAADAIAYLKGLGVDGRIERSKEKNNVIVVSASSNVLAQRLSHDFGERSNGKRLPEWFFALSETQQKSVLRHLFCGDALINLKPATPNRGGGRLSESIRFVTVSYRLASGVRDALLGLGIRCSGMTETAKVDKNDVSHKECYRILIPRRFMREFGFKVAVKRRDIRQVEHRENGEVYTLIPIRKISRSSHTGTVYNLTSSGHDSYLTDAGTSKNCGLGKGPMQLVWAQNVARHTNRNVLILAPLAVSHQFEREGEKFGIEVKRSDNGKAAGKLTVTNYDRLDKFNPDDYVGIAMDEVSIVKHWSGATQKAVTRFASKMPYRLGCTATPAPNDFIEMGTISEAIGEMTYTDMLATFFRQISDAEKRQNATATDIVHSKRLSWRVLQSFGQWAMKAHAFEPFWKWVSSWARACRKPSDVGPFDDSEFVLPPLQRFDHTVIPKTPPDGLMFTVPAFGLNQERQERRRTISERTELVSELVKGRDSSVIWCHLNDEGDALEKEIPDCVQVKGSQSVEEKEEKILAFLNGQTKRLITKPKIAGLGLNMQHCAHVVSFVTRSFESFYQCFRRCYRFGQTRDVRLDVIATEGEVNVRKNMERKERQSATMFESVIRFMNQAEYVGPGKASISEEVPSWLSKAS